MARQEAGPDRPSDRRTILISITSATQVVDIIGLGDYPTAVLFYLPKL
jgi:hypothetical protein